MIVSAVTGLQDPADVDSDLLSPPLRDLYNSLPNNIKEVLNIPLKASVNSKDVALNGVVNLAMDVNDEKIEKNQNKTDDSKDRKISTVTPAVTKF